MKLIQNDLLPEFEEGDGSVEFIMDGYFYNIGQFEDMCWITRMTVEDYDNGLDTWEEVERWKPEGRQVFKFLSSNKKINDNNR
jgi:hypothetical protein